MSIFYPYLQPTGDDLHIKLNANDGNEEVMRAIRAAINTTEPIRLYRLNCALGGWSLAALGEEHSARSLKQALKKAKLYIWMEVKTGPAKLTSDLHKLFFCFCFLLFSGKSG